MSNFKIHFCPSKKTSNIGIINSLLKKIKKKSEAEIWLIKKEKTNREKILFEIWHV